MAKRPSRALMGPVLAAAVIAAACSTDAETSVPRPQPAVTTTVPQPELPFAAELEDTLNGVLEQAATDGVVEPDNPLGFTLTVMVPGYQPWVWVSGESEPGVPITADTAFCSGSATKSFIAALVLQLAEEGKLSLDDPLSMWLPDIRNVDNNATIRQLLNHTSGIHQPNHHPDFWPTVFADGSRVWSNTEILSTFLLEPYSATGTEWHYSNAGYTLLGRIIEQATGSTVSVELRERFFDPLGLTTAFFHPKETARGEVAEGWFDIYVLAPAVDIDLALEAYSEYPWASTMPEAGGIFASSRDLATWAQALWGDASLLSPQTMDEMLEFVAPEPDDERGTLIAGYGLGAVRYNPDLFDGKPVVVGHSGGALFYSAAAAHLPDYGVTIGAALNSDHDIFGSLLSEVTTVITANVEPAI